MPGSPAELEAAVDEQDAMTAEARQGALAGMVPAAREPLDEAAVNALGMTLAEAVPILSSGQVGELAIPEVQGDLDRLPQELASPLLTVAAFVAQAGVPGAERYAFDPQEAMESNAGLQHATQLIAQMARDPKILAALGGEAGPAAPDMGEGEAAAAPPEEG